MNEWMNSSIRETPFPPFLFPGIMAVFVQKITFIRRKIRKKLLPPELLFLARICTKSFVGWGFVLDPTATGGAYSAPSDALAVFRAYI